jgi:hypothetical protein
MSESETFPIALAGRTWAIPHLPFRLLKKVQPLVMRRGAQFRGAGGGVEAVLSLDEAALDDLAEAVWLAISHVDRGISRAQFDDLPFGSQDLFFAVPSLIRACGLLARTAAAAAEDSSEKK